MFACAAAAAEEDEEEGVEPFTEDDGMVVTGFGGSACLIAGLDVEEEELELEFEDAADAVSLGCRRAWIESIAEGASPAVERDEGEVARGECGSGAMGR